MTKLNIISVIIVNYKCWDDLQKCLDALVVFSSATYTLDVIVVDNDLTSDTYLNFKNKFLSVRFVQNSGNNGFSNACNFGTSFAKGSLFLYLNPDTVSNEIAISTMADAIETNSDYGIVSCQQVNRNQAIEKEVRFLPRILTLFGFFRIFFNFFNKKIIQKHKAFVCTEWVSGSVVMMRKDTYVQLGGWNEDYWMYFEDVDICKRTLDLGKKIILLKKVQILHNHGGASRINVLTSALTKSQVCISKHVYIHNNFSMYAKYLVNIFLMIYVIFTSFLNALLGLLLCFIPKMRVRIFLFKNLLHYYTLCVLHRTWLSKLSMNHPSKMF